MPRIFHVTFTKEFDAAIVAENEDELRAALENQSGEFDDWADTVEWDFHSTDTLLMCAKNPERIPKTFSEPDMGIDSSGECVDIYDYKQERPDYMKAVEAEAAEVARKLTLDKVNMKLPFGE